ncbi:MAG: ATP-binding protein [Myxococcota bacterium]
MDDATFEGLAAALAATPENKALLKVVLDAVHAGQRWSRGLALLEQTPPSVLAGDPSLSVSAARVALEAKLPARALEWVRGDAPDACLVRARACLALERRAEGLDWYKKGVAGNATLEDPELEAALGASVRTVERADGRSPLRVISNDDTAALEADRLMDSPAKKVTFADVGGLEDVKDQIRKRIILPFQKPSLFQRFKKRVGGGILLYGPPGCGKTLLARATAGECSATFFSVAISDVLDMYIGESERKLHAIFEKARSSTPAVLFFDELEALAGKRQHSREATSAKMVSQFLSEMDGFAQNNSGVLVLGATNVPWAVDSAFRRPGRFDRVQFVPPPDRPARESILTLLLAGRPVDKGIDVGGVARRTSGFSGADLEQVVETAADGAISRSLSSGNESVITQADLEEAAEEVKPTATEWLTTARNYARYANESGHYDDVLKWLDQHGKA